MRSEAAYRETIAADLEADAVTLSAIVRDLIRPEVQEMIALEIADCGIRARRYREGMVTGQ